MYVWCTRFGSLVLLGTVVALAPAQNARPHVEVVFCLDTTGSMGGLINAAKQRIWTISNQIAGGNPTPHVKIGLVAYRDRGDEYVTRILDLTDDLDHVYQSLIDFQAKGGGDFPESVNQALHEAVTKISWGKDKSTLKFIFLIGDAPPHIDYGDDVKYQDTCKLAVARNIIINSVQCGTHADTKRYWQEICRLAEGSYVQIDAKGGPIVAIATPYDKELAKINAELANSTLVFGDRLRQAEGKAKANAAAALPPAAAAERAGYSSKVGKTASYDLLDCIKDGKVKLDVLKKDELPAELQELNFEQQKAYLDKLTAVRRQWTQKAAELDRKRGLFLETKLAEEAMKANYDSFDCQVLLILQQQAQRNGSVQYKAMEKGKR
ncbi:MAG: VWA domain-containing protein [Gemmataceae bacterium]|nr:VWA domain-containing protein [Gemmataceae bacterium]MCI0738337.1 VWA domain-containing protein [Gemmataceae bacterium]